MKHPTTLSGLVAHKSVLVQEVLEYLSIKPGGTYLDVTFGAGGHTRAILESDPTVRVIALDWDRQSVDEYAPAFIEEFGDRFKMIWGNFGQLYKIARKEGIESLDGVLADLGTSQMQIRASEGFSFTHDSPLDMRMSPAHQKMTASIVINESSEAVLRNIFWEFGEERFAKQIAAAVVEARSKRPITHTLELAQLVARIKPTNPKSRTHPATKVFQALRIYVNEELENIKTFIPVAVNLLKSGGRLACITFHSLEDRTVKKIYREVIAQGSAKLITKKAVVPTPEEIQTNRSARSAQLRVLERI